MINTSPPTSEAYARVKGVVTNDDGSELSTFDGTSVQTKDQAQYTHAFSTGNSGAVSQTGDHVTDQFSLNGAVDSVTQYSVLRTDDGVIHLVGQRQSPSGTPYESITMDIRPTDQGSQVEVMENPVDGQSSVTHTSADVTLTQSAQGYQIMNVQAAETIDGKTVHISAVATNSDKTPITALPLLVGLLT